MNEFFNKIWPSVVVGVSSPEAIKQANMTKLCTLSVLGFVAYNWRSIKRIF